MINKHNSNFIRERLLVLIDAELRQNTTKQKMFSKNPEGFEAKEMFIEFNEYYSSLESDSLAYSRNAPLQSNKKYSDSSYSTVTQSDSVNDLCRASKTTKRKRRESLKLLKVLSNKMPISLYEKKKSYHIPYDGTNAIEQFRNHCHI